MDITLVEKLVERHKRMVEQFIPDLADGMDIDDYNATEEQKKALRDATADCATDRIYDEEMQAGRETHGTEFREAGNRIAEHFFGKEGS